MNRPTLTALPTMAPSWKPAMASPGPTGPNRRVLSGIQRMLPYLLAASLTCAILVAGLRLDQADFTAPFTYEADALLILPFVKATLERGSHWRNERLGAPGIQELHDFPVVDHLHFGLIGLIGQIVPDPVVVFNLFYLLTYPLTTVITMFVFRSFGLSLPAAATGGILYAFQPYHYLRGEIHYFLSAYYIIPLTMMVALWVCQGRLPFFRRTETGNWQFAPWSRDSFIAVLIAAATASAGAYYAFFACALLCCAAIIGWVSQKTWRAAAAGFATVAGIVFVGFLNHVPAIVYQAEHGVNELPTQRWPEEAEMYGMKIIQLVLPVADHNNISIGGRTLVDIAAIRDRYASPIRPLMPFIETEYDPLGAIAAMGFLGLLAYAVLPTRRVWPWAPLAGLTLFATLLGTVGGLGDVFNLLVSPQVRCHNRICIYIAFLSLLAVCWAIDRFFDTRTGRLARFRWPFFLLVGVFGIWDQTDCHWFPQTRIVDARYRGMDDIHNRVAAEYRADRAFYTQVEAMLPEGAVYCYPFIPYPEAVPYQESGSRGSIANYDMVKGYLHTQRLRWSFGAVRNREADIWARDVAEQSPAQLLAEISQTGFDGLLIDQRGMNPQRFTAMMRELNAILGRHSPRIVNTKLGLTFLDLRDYRRERLDRME